jgi:multiple sugar transport system permease protein
MDIKSKPFLPPENFISLEKWEKFGNGLVNIFAVGLLGLYLFPILFMISTAFMPRTQLGDRYSPPYPGEPETLIYNGEEIEIYYVPVDNDVQELALVNPGRQTSEFVDPENPDQGIITWEGSWRTLGRVYRFAPTLDNFREMFGAIRFPTLLKNTLIAVAVSEIGILVSSTIVAYGFARFPLPGGNLLFYIMIATLLIPEKVTLIPTYFFFVRVLDWNGSWLPILIPMFFGNAVFIFLLRQNFKTIPKEMEEAAMLDGAGPLRILVSIVIPQSWPVIFTTGLLHFFFIWNETRQASLYLSIARNLAPVSFGIANFQSLAPFQNLTQASALIIMIVPVVVLLLSQRFFLHNMVITGSEKND